MTIPEQKGSPRRKSLLRRALRVIVLGGGLLFVFGGLLSIVIFLFWSYPAAMEARAELEKIRLEWGVGSLEEMNAFFDLPEGQKDLVPHLNKAWRDYSTVKENLPNPDPTYAEEDSELEDYLSWPDIPQVTAKLNPANPNWGQVSTAEKFLKELDARYADHHQTQLCDLRCALLHTWQ